MPTTILVVDDDHASSLDRLVGRSHALKELRETIERLARDPQITVLFAGETGTGRALAAAGGLGYAPVVLPLAIVGLE